MKNRVHDWSDLVNGPRTHYIPHNVRVIRFEGGGLGTTPSMTKEDKQQIIRQERAMRGARRKGPGVMGYLSGDPEEKP